MDGAVVNFLFRFSEENIVDWELWDLESNDAKFIDEVSAWYASSLVTPNVKHSLCSTTYLMGGYDILGNYFLLFFNS